MEFNDLVIPLRVLHIVAGTFWVGAALFQSLFMGPALEAIEPEQRQRFMRGLKARGIMIVMPVAAMTTIAAGIGLLALNPGLSKLPLMLESRWGLGILVGAGAAIFSVINAIVFIEPKLKKLSSAGFDGLPALSPDEAQALQGGLIKFAMIEVVALLIAVVSMASARFL